MSRMEGKRYARHTVQFGARSIDVSVSFNQRKNLSISVHPDMRVTVDAPRERSIADVLARVKKRAPWILKQQRYYDRFHPLQPERAYVAGESHLYLGKQYRLRLSRSGEHAVKLKGGYFTASLSEPESASEVKGMLMQWYREHALTIFTSRLHDLHGTWRGKGLPVPKLNIQEMRSRWGSCTKRGTITLNLHLIKAPLRCIDYVIMHELCHLVEHNHTDKFYKLLAKHLPDWERRKAQLEKVVVL